MHRTEINGLTDIDNLHWLVILVDVSRSHQQTQVLLQDALTDSLTGLANRRHFTDSAASLVQYSQQQLQELAVLVLDLDHFKSVNDRYGHEAGDQVLSFVSQIFKRCLRDGDLAARLGGEEFSILLPGANQTQALAVGERIRRSIAGCPVPLSDGSFLTVSISIGVSMWRTDESEIQAAFKRADIALYQAKMQGRNRVVAYTAPRATEGAPLVDKTSEQGSSSVESGVDE